MLSRINERLFVTIIKSTAGSFVMLLGLLAAPFILLSLSEELVHQAWQLFM